MFKKFKAVSFTAWIILALFAAASPAVAQNSAYQTKRARAFELYKQNKFLEALPVFEELAGENSQDGEVLMYAGFVAFASAETARDAEAKRKAGSTARDYFLAAQKLGFESVLSKSMLQSIALDGMIAANTFTNHIEAEKTMHQAEEAFVKGDFKKALEAYQKALQLDPNLYEAALFAGDVYYKSDNPQKAAEWFAKAIKIDPNRETAYRYWGDSLAKEGKETEAREKYIDAFVAEPYSKFARANFITWAKKNGITLANPAINIPTSVSAAGNGNTNITLDPSVMTKDKKDGSSAWLYYGITRAAWTMPGKNGKLSERFAKAYPNETKYRHSLAEETDALRQVLSFLDKDIKNKKVENLDVSLANLKKLGDGGLLESYILLTRMDEGLFRDYKPYLAANREKLRRYVVEYIMTGGK
jgi:tetratricopeptide (TPR) repeat protein